MANRIFDLCRKSKNKANGRDKDLLGHDNYRLKGLRVDLAANLLSQHPKTEVVDDDDDDDEEGEQCSPM